MKKQNIFWKWWFTLIVVPIYLVLINFLIEHFGHNKNSVIITWFLILVTALTLQFFILAWGSSVKRDLNLHYLYILIVFNITMFIDVVINNIFGLQSKLSENMWNWVAWMITSAITTCLLFVIKIIVWLWLSHYFLRMKNVHNSEETYKKQLAKLQQEMDNLKRSHDDGTLETELRGNSGILYSKKHKVKVVDEPVNKSK